MNIGIVVFDGAEELDFVGPWEVLTSSNEVFKWQKKPAPDQVFLISQTGQTVRCAKGMRVEADHSFATCPDLDIILLPGGQGTRREMTNPAMLSFVHRQAQTCAWVTSVCTGSFVLVAAGPASGKRVTTHWAAFPELATIEGVGEMIRDKRHVRDGNVVTSAGVSAGIDMALWLTGERFGAAHGALVQKSIQYDPEPPFAVV
ncbi:DJ-1/PfpI family protein [Emcibacter sp. SYSU 3D8]|uniref:DJ-1/PfpI family protein n=1 Tax=Emcibacter sp. SYSU 3D8 TaxID=3133969 RepID=UPI0031FE7DAD